jgi:hypothetical protein
MKARAPGLATRAAATLSSASASFHSLAADGAQALPPRERHGIIPDDKVAWRPAPRRPLRRDLKRLAARWEGWR